MTESDPTADPATEIEVMLVTEAYNLAEGQSLVAPNGVRVGSDLARADPARR